MKKYIFFIFMGVTLTLKAQEIPEGLKADSVSYCNNNSEVITHKGKKTGLYNLKQKTYLIKPGAQAIFYYEQVNAYALIGKKENYIFKDGQRLENSVDKGVEIRKMDDNRYAIGNRKLPTLYRDNEDNLLLDKGYGKTGVYNLKTRKWEVQDNYLAIYIVNDVLFALQVDNCDKVITDELGFDGYLDVQYSYDIFKKNENGYQLTKSKINELKDIDVPNLLGIEKCTYPDSLIVLGWRGDKMELWNIDLFYQENEDDLPSFTVLGSLKNHDFLTYNPEHRLALGHDSSAEAKLKLYDFSPEDIEPGWEVNLPRELIEQKGFSHFKSSANELLMSKIIIGDVVEQQMDDSLIKGYTAHHEESSHRCNYGLKKLNDSLLLITDFELGELWPIYDEYYELVESYEADPSYFRSGVFNLNTKKWIVEPAYQNVFQGAKGWVVSKSQLEIEKDIYNYAISAYDEEYFLLRDDKIVTGPLSKSELYDNDEMLKALIIDYEVDSLFKGPCGIDNCLDYDNGVKYFRTGKDLGICYPEKYEQDDLVSVIPAEAFVYHSKEFNYTFKCDRENLILEYMDTIVKVPMLDGKINFLFHEYNGEELYKYSFQMINGNDTTLVSIQKGGEYLKDKNMLGASISFIHNSLVLDQGYLMYYDVYDEYGEGYTAYFETANSTIWEYKDESFVKAAPNYAAVQACPYGFIVKTPHWDGKPLMVDDIMQWDKDSWKPQFEGGQDSTYILLDKEFQATAFIDYYNFDFIEDLGFGLSIRTEKGCMFVDYSGKALTNDEWDKFELEGDKLKAIETRELIDEYGEPLFDENGNEITDPVARFELIALPKK